MQIVVAHAQCHVTGTLCAKSNPMFCFPTPTLPIHYDTFGGSEEDLRVFTGETANAKANSSENFLSPDQNWPNFAGFGGAWGQVVQIVSIFTPKG